MKAILSPSLLSSDLSNSGAVLEALENSGLGWIHLDVMDGLFVPNITFGAPFIKALRSKSGLFFDTHLMIENPDAHLQDFADAGVDLCVVHLEALNHAQRTLTVIRRLGMKAGLAINPSTDIANLRWLLADLDLILIMGVNPGFSGQKFIPQTLEKLAECRYFLRKYHYEGIPLQVDGGVNLENASSLVSAGANVLVSGSAFFRSDDYKKTFAAYNHEFELSVPLNSEKAIASVRSWRQNRA